MKILFVNPKLMYGGASKMLVSVANHYAEQGHDVTILTLFNGRILQKLSPKVKHVHKELTHSRLHVYDRMCKLWWLRRFIRENAYDVCFAFLDPAKSLTLLSCKGLRTKCILSERGNTVGRRSLKNWITKVLEKIVTPDGFVFQTSYAKDAYPIKSVKKISTVINNAFVAHPYVKRYNYKLRLQDKKKIILSIGRLDLRDKRQDVLIKAFAEIVKREPEVYLKFLGDGADENLLKAMVKELGIERNVLFAGYCSNIYEEILNGYIYCLSSDNEGIPNALMEAMSVGIPCVSTDCRPGGARLLINESTGILVPRADVDALSAALLKLLTDKVEWQLIGENGCNYVLENFAESKINKQWDTLLESVMQN